MNLPEDIIRYLVNFVKPKIYTLLSRDCRDRYFTKNGVSISFITGLESSQILQNYRVKIANMISPLIYEFHKFKPISGRVSEINTGSNLGQYYFEEYLEILSIFPNLKRIKCRVILYEVNEDYQDKLSKLKVLKGVIFHLKRDFDKDVSEKLAQIGYKFVLGYDADIIKCSQRVLDSVIGLEICDPTKKVFLEKYRNIKTIFCNCGQRHTDHNRIILENPCIKKIKYSSRCIPYPVVGNNGMPIKQQPTWDNFTFKPKTEYTQNDYCIIKNCKKIIDIMDLGDIDALLKLERESNCPKRIKVGIFVKIDIGLITELLRYFDVYLEAQFDMLHYYTSQYRVHKIKTNPVSGLRLTFKIGDGKLYLTQNEVGGDG